MKPFLPALLMTFAFITPLAAEPIAKETLAKENTQCRKECDASNGELVCRVLCDCAVEQFIKTFDKAGFDAYLKEIEAEKLSAANAAITQKIGTHCVGQVDLILQGLQNQNKPKP